MGQGTSCQRNEGLVPHRGPTANFSENLSVPPKAKLSCEGFLLLLLDLAAEREEKKSVTIETTSPSTVREQLPGLPTPSAAADGRRKKSSSPFATLNLLSPASHLGLRTSNTEELPSDGLNRHSHRQVHISKLKGAEEITGQGVFKAAGVCPDALRGEDGTCLECLPLLVRLLMLETQLLTVAVGGTFLGSVLTTRESEPQQRNCDRHHLRWDQSHPACHVAISRALYEHLQGRPLRKISCVHRGWDPFNPGFCQRQQTPGELVFFPSTGPRTLF